MYEGFLTVRLSEVPLVVFPEAVVPRFHCRDDVRLRPDVRGHVGHRREVGGQREVGHEHVDALAGGGEVSGKVL